MPMSSLTRSAQLCAASGEIALRGSNLEAMQKFSEELIGLAADDPIFQLLSMNCE